MQFQKTEGIYTEKNRSGSMFPSLNTEMWLLERDVLITVARKPDSQEFKDNQIADLF